MPLKKVIREVLGIYVRHSDLVVNDAWDIAQYIRDAYRKKLISEEEVKKIKKYVCNANHVP